MSQREVEDTLEGLLQDDALGLRANIERLASDVLGPVGDPNPPSGDFDFVRWALPGTALRPTTRGNIMLRPRQWRPNLRNGNLREGIVVVDVGFETFAASPKDIETQISATTTALIQCLDSLRAYSDAHDGSVADVIDPVLFNYGAFEGTTSNGFVATVTISEVSHVD